MCQCADEEQGEWGGCIGGSGEAEHEARKRISVEERKVWEMRCVAGDRLQDGPVSWQEQGQREMEGEAEGRRVC